MLNDLSLNYLKTMTDVDIDNAIIVETASTGETSNDEFLSISIVDIKGNVILDSLLKPIDLVDWDSNPFDYGIRPLDVLFSPDIYVYKDLIADTLSNASLIVGFNLEFKLNLLIEQVVPNLTGTKFDVRYPFIDAYTSFNSEDPNMKPLSIKRCARYFGFSSDFSNTLDNARAIAHCFNSIQNDFIQELPKVQEIADRKQEAYLKAYKEERRRIIATKALLIAIIGSFQVGISLAIPLLKIPIMILCFIPYLLIFTYPRWINHPNCAGCDKACENCSKCQCGKVA